MAALLITSVVAALFRDEAEFAPGSPEAAVQNYLRALNNDDFHAIYDGLSPELQEKCSIEDMFKFSDRWQTGEKRITIDNMRTFDDTTFITVRIAQFQRVDLFSSGEYSFDETFALKQFDGSWKLSQLPWPHFHCSTDSP